MPSSMVRESGPRESGPRIIVITGTDTGVGKTVLTALLLAHLRRTGQHALAIKPFCSGSRADARLLRGLQDNELTLDQINPFFFPEAVAPLVAARKHSRPIQLADALEHIQSVSRTLLERGQSGPPFTNRSQLKTKNLKLKTPPSLLIEGAGGLLTPLGEKFTALDLIRELNSEAIVVSRNRLGTINHTLLTIRALQTAGVQQLSVVLMDCGKSDFSAGSNHEILSELLAPILIHRLPFLGPRCRTVAAIKTNAARLHRMLACA